MRWRALRFLGPVLFASVTISAWSVWTSERDRTDASGRFDALLWQDAAQQAVSALERELADLTSLGGFAMAPPTGTSTGTPTGAPRPVSLDDAERQRLLDALERDDEDGLAALAELQSLGYAAPGDVAQVLQKLGAADLDAVMAGGTISVDRATYTGSLQTLRELLRSYEIDAAVSLQQLGQRLDEPAWSRPEIVVPTIALSGMGLAGALLGLGFFIREQERARRLEGRNTRLVRLVDVSRRLSSAESFHELAQGLAEDTASVGGGDAAAFYVNEDDGILRPVAVLGRLGFGPVPVGVGAIGRAVESANAIRVVVPADPAFSGHQNAVGLLVAPLVVQGTAVGALVTVDLSGRLAHGDDEVSFRLLAQAAAPAIEAARRLETTNALVLADPLTGLGNRRRLDEDLATMVPEARVHGRSVGFLMVDIDRFKTFNDTFGHPAGDRLLRHVGEIIRSAVRQSDIVYRFGGEEFAVLLPDAVQADTLAVAERIRATIETADIDGQAVTVSVGVSWAGTPDAGDLLEQADAALYDAKRAGRNQVVVSAL